MKTKDRLLHYFQKNQGEVLTRDDLLTEVWGYKANSAFFSDNKAGTKTLDVHVSKLRKDGHDIQTIHSVGYMYRGEG